jgi:biotin carboxyl carrier protein
MSTTFRVILCGCQPGVPLSIAARYVAAVCTELSVEQAKALLTAGELPMTAGLTTDQARKYKTALEGLGCRCRVEQDAAGTATPDASGHTSAPPVAGHETVLRGVDAFAGFDAEKHDYWVHSVDVHAGQTVGLGDPLLTLECAGWLLEIPAPTAGVVRDILVEPGQPVSDGLVALNMQVPAEMSTMRGLADPGDGPASRPARAQALRMPSQT